MRLEYVTDVRGGVTLVECTVTNDGTASRRVHVQNCLDGPVWPPRRHGRPISAWTGSRRDGSDAERADAGFAGVLAPGETFSVGYASPAPPTDPPVELSTEAPDAATDTRGRSDGDGGQTDPDTATAPVEVLAECGDPRPPRDAVGATPSGSPDEAGDTGGDDGTDGTDGATSADSKRVPRERSRR